MNTTVHAHIDREVMRDDPSPPPSPRYTVDGIMASLRNVASVSEVLRIIGAAVIVASMSLFLLQGWSEGNDISRYLKLLAQTGLLGLGGLALSHGLKEAKGARIFFGLALVSVPANFTILGALIYSVLQLDGGLTAVPGFATWQLGEAANIGLTVAGAFAVLVPVTLFCFAIMARHSARALTLHFVALNLLLLVPVRMSVLAGGIALLGTFYAAWALRRMLRHDAALKTPEGRFSLTALFIPLGIVLFRSLYFYEVEALTIAMLSATVYFALRQVSLFPDRNPRVATLIDVASLPAAIVTTGSLAAAVGFDIEFLAPFTALVFAAFGIDIMRRTPSHVLTGFTSILVNLTLALGFITSVGLEPTVLTAFLAALAGLLLVMTGVWLSVRSAVLAGILILMAAGWFGFVPIAALVVDANWVTLAIIGATTIGLGSLLERHGVAMKIALVRWTEGFNAREREDVLDDSRAM